MPWGNTLGDERRGSEKNKKARIKNVTASIHKGRKSANLISGRVDDQRTEVSMMRHRDGTTRSISIKKIVSVVQ